MDTPNELIKHALGHAVTLIGNGVTPTDALEKSADAFDLNYDFTHRVGEALNVALHYNYFKSAEDKSADFPLADIPKVVKHLYNSTEKTAAQYQAETFTSVDPYEKLPNFNQVMTDPKYKAAYVKMASAQEDTRVPLSPKAVFEKSSNYVLELQKQATNASVREVGTKNDMEAIFLKLAAHFKKEAAARTAFEEFESQAFSKYGENAVEYVDLLHKLANSKEARGVHDSGYNMFDDCYEVSQFDRFMKLASELRSVKKEAQEIQDNLAFEKDYIQEIYKTADLIRKGVVEKAAQDKEASGLLDEVFTHIREGLKKEDKKSPDHIHSPMDTLERQTILQDLLVRDSILSKEDPHKVIAAYEQILRVAPNIAKEKEVVRAILRKMIASQAVGPFDINQWLEADNNLAKSKVINHTGNLSGGK